MTRTDAPMAPLYANCPDCRTAPTHRTRQRQMGRAFQPDWHQCCAQHVPGAGRETILARATTAQRATIERLQAQFRAAGGAHETEAL